MIDRTPVSHEPKRAAASRASERARPDLQRLGIVLDFLQIQKISDEHGYLAAIGRRQNAAVQRDARIAEATAEAEARKVAAEQQRLGGPLSRMEPRTWRDRHCVPPIPQ